MGYEDVENSMGACLPGGYIATLNIEQHNLFQEFMHDSELIAELFEVEYKVRVLSKRYIKNPSATRRELDELVDMQKRRQILQKDVYYAVKAWHEQVVNGV